MFATILKPVLNLSPAPVQEFIVFSLFAVVGIFLFCDEEPLFDPTDWNIIHVLLLMFCILIVTLENVIRSRHGQYVYKDQVLVFSTFSFWFFLENYVRAIIIVFCFHCLTPLELELVELVEVFQGLSSWYTASLLPTLIAVVFTMGLGLLANFYCSWYSARALLMIVFTITGVLLVSLLTVLWDFLFTSMTSCQFVSNPKEYYTHSRSALSYNMTSQVIGAFDWHMSQPGTFVMRFEDLYLFYLQLLNCVALYCCSYVWLFILNDLVIRGRGVVAPSYTMLGVGLRWLDHTLWCFVYSHLAVVVVGARVWLRVSIELIPFAL